VINLFTFSPSSINPLIVTALYVIESKKVEGISFYLETGVGSTENVSGWNRY
jgi:hypothetical protein